MAGISNVRWKRIGQKFTQHVFQQESVESGDARRRSLIANGKRTVNTAIGHLSQSGI
jgi:hypothetical protein